MRALEVMLAVLIIAGFLFGIRLMQSPRTALWGNRLGAFCMALAVLFAVQALGAFQNYLLWVYILLGGGLGVFLGQNVKMIQMPQAVALLNGFGGGASALVAGIAAGLYPEGYWLFWLTASLALGVGSLTFGGSVVAALKLQGWVSQRPLFLKGHGIILRGLLLAGAFAVILSLFLGRAYFSYLLPVLVTLFACYGIFLALRVGGADMPVMISFLNSLSGLAASVSGLAVSNPLLAGGGALVGVAGMILTRLMCRAMNRSLTAVLGGIAATFSPAEKVPEEEAAVDEGKKKVIPRKDLPQLLLEAKKVIIVPGYGMALAQAQQAVKELIDALEEGGKEVKVAIHPVAGRMPGHMNVLLAEVGIDYEKLYDMDTINPEFAQADLVIVVGACDVVNPAAQTVEGTPISGMPILRVEEAENIIVCNLDDQPGYSGVENSLYGKEKVITMWGNAAETVPWLTKVLKDVKA